MRRVEPRLFVLLAFAVGVAATALVMAVPGLRFAYRAPQLHLVLETAEGLIALLAAWLIVGRFQRDFRLSQLLLIVSLMLLGLANLLLSVVPPLVGVGPEDGFSTWAPLTVRSMGTLLIVGAALLPDQVVAHRWRDLRFVIGLVVGFIAIVTVFVAGFEGIFGAAERIAIPADRSVHTVVTGLDAVLGLQAILAVLWTAAAYGFTRRSERTGDEFTVWLASAAAVSATARISYLLFPSMYTGYVYIGDVLRLAFHVLLLIGAMREIRSYWEGMADLVRSRERRRVARDLHDGIAQELMFIAAQTRRARKLIDDEPTDRVLHQLQNAADRAVDEARRAIRAMSVAEEEDLESALRHMVDYMDARVDGQVVLVKHASIEVERDRREDLLRIVREAVVNAAKHSGSGSIAVVLSDNGAPRITIEDRGRGFDPGSKTDHGGFGLVSMRERADAIGAKLEVTSDERGTTIEVKL